MTTFKGIAYTTINYLFIKLIDGVENVFKVLDYTMT